MVLAYFIVCWFLEAVAAVDFRSLGMLDIRVVSGCGSPGSIRCTAPQLHTSHLNEVKIFHGTRKTQCSKLPTRCLREIRCSLCNSPRSSSVQDMFEFGKLLIFLLISQSNFKIQVQTQLHGISGQSCQQSVPEPKW